MRRALQVVVMMAAVCVAATPLPRAMVERVYSRGVYAVIQPRVTAFSNHFSFALLDVALVTAAVAIVVWWIVGLRRAPRGRAWWAVGGLAIDTGWASALVYFWFLAAWGLNYQREPLRLQLDFHPDRVTEEALRDLALRDVDALNQLYAPAHRTGWSPLRDTGSSLGSGFNRVQLDLGMRWMAAGGVPKRSLLDFYFRRVAVDGMTDPFFLETLGNQSLLPFERPFVVAHEWGHLAGYADESEANFLAWLICLRGDDRDRYSAWVSLYGTIVTGLPRATRGAVSERLQLGPRQDLRAMADRVRAQVNPTASRAGYAVYDRFLKANRVEAGVRSYNDVVRLLLGTNFKADGSPILRSGP
jgi:Protein of unknown function (DUF3810)